VLVISGGTKLTRSATERVSPAVNRYVEKLGKKYSVYISSICQEAPCGRIWTKFGVEGRLPDAINCGKFFGNRLRGLDSKEGQILAFFID